MTARQLFDIIERMSSALQSLFDHLWAFCFATLPSWLVWWIDKASIWGAVADELGINIAEVTVIELAIGGAFIAILCYQLIKFILPVLE